MTTVFMLVQAFTCISHRNNKKNWFGCSFLSKIREDLEKSCFLPSRSTLRVMLHLILRKLKFIYLFDRTMTCKASVQKNNNNYDMYLVVLFNLPQKLYNLSHILKCKIISYTKLMYYNNIRVDWSGTTSVTSLVLIS